MIMEVTSIQIYQPCWGYDDSQFKDSSSMESPNNPRDLPISTPEDHIYKMTHHGATVEPKKVNCQWFYMLPKGNKSFAKPSERHIALHTQGLAKEKPVQACRRLATCLWHPSTLLHQRQHSNGSRQQSQAIPLLMYKLFTSTSFTKNWKLPR